MNEVIEGLDVPEVSERFKELHRGAFLIGQ